MAFHPGPSGQYASILFTAPQSGLLTFESDVRSTLSHQVDLQVRVNDLPVSTELAVTSSRSYDLTTPLAIAAGSTVEFLVGASLDGDAFDTTAIQMVANIAQPVPEPATMAVLGVGALGLLRRRRKA